MLLLCYIIYSSVYNDYIKFLSNLQLRDVAYILCCRSFVFFNPCFKNALRQIIDLNRSKLNQQLSIPVFCLHCLYNALASANANCCPFQVNIDCSKFIIDGLQQRCYMTLLVSLFVTMRNLLFGEFLPKKHYYSLTENNHKFQASVTKRCTCLSKNSEIIRQNCLKVPMKKWIFLKKIHYTWTFWQVVFEVSCKIFFTCLQKPVCVIYGRYIHIHITFCKKYLFPFLLFLRWKEKEKISLGFGIIFAAWFDQFIYYHIII